MVWDERVDGWFRAPAVCAITGITYRQLDYWDRLGMVSPSGTPARGSGTARRYTLADVRVLFLVKLLLDQGLSLVGNRNVLAALAEGGAPEYVVVADGCAHPGADALDVDRLLAGKPIALVMHMPSVRDVADAAVEEFRRQGRRAS